MKIAALFDIHGNLPALNAVLDDLRTVQPDLIVIGGDVVSGPMPEQTLRRLLQLQSDKHVQFISGNNDREVVTIFDGRPVIRHYLPAISKQGYEEARWVAKQLTQAERDALASFPEQLEYNVEGSGKILFCHATPRSDEELFTPATSEERIKSIFSNIQQDIIVCGHTHIQFTRQVEKRNILNAGSVGMPFADQPGAYWLLLHPDGYTFQRSSYDPQAAAQEIIASGCPFAHQFVQSNVLGTPSIEAMTKTLEAMARK